MLNVTRNGWGTTCTFFCVLLLFTACVQVGVHWWQLCISCSPAPRLLPTPHSSPRFLLLCPALGPRWLPFSATPKGNKNPLLPPEIPKIQWHRPRAGGSAGPGKVEREMAVAVYRSAFTSTSTRLACRAPLLDAARTAPRYSTPRQVFDSSLA